MLPNTTRSTPTPLTVRKMQITDLDTAVRPPRTRHPAGTQATREAVDGLSAGMPSMGGPLLGLLDRAPLLPDASDSADGPDEPRQPSRLKRWAASVGKLFTPPVLGATAAASVQAVAEPPRAGCQWRPTDPQQQHFHELIDSIGKAPTSHMWAIANAIGDRLRRSGLVLPTRQHPTGMSRELLQSPQWLEALEARRVNVSDLLGAVKFLEYIEPAHRPELRRRLITAFEVVVQQLAQDHPGIRELQASCAVALRPHSEAKILTPEAAQRMTTFKLALTALVSSRDIADATAGQLATRLHECLHGNSNMPIAQELEIIGRVPSAIEAVIRKNAAAQRIAGPLREAAHRLDAYLRVRTCQDLPPIDRLGGNGMVGGRMPAWQARSFTLGTLLIATLDPAAVDALLRRDRLNEWMHPTVADFPERLSNARSALAVLSQTLPALHANQLISETQADELWRQANARLQSAAVPTT